MRSFLLIILASYAVRCDDNYYVIQMPEVRRQTDSRSPMKVYWNVPSMQCASKKIPFNNLDRFGIIQNSKDSFRGEKITILYDPGLFPALLKKDSDGSYQYRNGGVPQEGDLERHIEAFRNSMNTSVPDPDFNGVGVIDFESWRPVFRQNFGVLEPYKALSVEIEQKLHWWWPKSWIQAEAKRRFEEAARKFMQTTISVAKQMRPKALWGYYGFPYCFNMAPANMAEYCAKNVNTENDGLYWLWGESTALYPSVYSSKTLDASQLGALVRGRVREALRVRRPATPVLPYLWVKYRDGGFMSKKDLEMALKMLYKSGAEGFIIWGSSKDVNTVDKCTQLHNYIENVLGPAVATYTTIDRRSENDVNGDIFHNITNIENVGYNQTETQVQPDPDYDNVPLENDTQNIVQNFKEYMKNIVLSKNLTDNNETTISPDTNSLLDILFQMIHNITDSFEDANSTSSSNIKRNVITVTYSTTDENYSTNGVSTTEQYIESTTKTSTNSDFDITTEDIIQYPTTEGTTKETALDITTNDFTTYTTDQTTESTTFKTTEESSTTEFVTTNGYEVNTAKTSTSILAVNITEHLLVNKNVSKNEKKGFAKHTTESTTTEITTEVSIANTSQHTNGVYASNDEVGDAKNSKKGLPRRLDFEDSGSSDTPMVHQVDF